MNATSPILSALAQALALALGLATACAPPSPVKDHARIDAEKPRSILIVPAINRSVDVSAPDLFLATISRPVAERGYYVFPVNLVRQVLADEGLSDADLVHRANPKRLGELFGADAVLYITIEEWTAKYAVLHTTTSVTFSYILKSGRTGEELWTSREHTEYTPQSQASGNPVADLLGAALLAALGKAAPDYLPLARQANEAAVSGAERGLPPGPYAPAVKRR